MACAADDRSTCTGATPSCDDAGNTETCAVGPIGSNCTITVVLGDGTTHDVAVTVGVDNTDFCHNVTTVVSPANDDFASATCAPPNPMFGDEGLVDGSHATDASNDDGATDAPLD